MDCRLPPLVRRGWPFALALLALTALLGPATLGPGRPDASPGRPAPAGTPIATEVAAAATGTDQAGASGEAALPSAPATAPAATAPAATATDPTVAPTLHPTARPTPRPTAPPATAAPVPPLSSCPVFPSTNVWNKRVDGLPVASTSAVMIAAIGLTAALHPDFSAAGGYGIPFNVVGSGTPRVSVSFQYADESDPGPYPIPASSKIEGGSDRHLIVVDTSSCTLYELFAAARSGSRWTAGSGAIWNLASNHLRPDGWTSADAAGLPIFPGLVRYSEVAAGAIRHAIRFTAPRTCAGYVYPARHEAGSGSCSTFPPMGLRVRLKASVDISKFGPQARVILLALQRYGMILADNGSPWYITGAPDSRWNDDGLHALGQLHGSDFEVVDTSGFTNG
jgi:hypothetical protein